MARYRLNIETAQADPEAWEAVEEIVRIMCENGLRDGMDSFDSVDDAVERSLQLLKDGVIVLQMSEDEDSEFWEFRPGPNFRDLVQQHGDHAHMVWELNFN